MRERLKGLEVKKKELCDKLKQLGAFRRGSLSLIYRRCGRTNCKCTQSGHSGHPQYIWSATIKGKSYARNITLGPPMQKYKEEIENYQKFLKIRDDLIDVSEKIADEQPIPEVKSNQELERLKKKLQRMFIQKLRGK